MSKIEVDTIAPQSGTTVTLGEAGDTVNIPSGVTLTNSGTATGFGISWQSDIKTSAFTAVAGEGYWINTTSAAVTVTLPASASVGDEIEFTDYARTWNTNNLTLNQNSLNFQGFSSPNPVYDVNGQHVRIVYSGATQGWIPTVDDDVTFETEQIYSADFLVIAGGGAGGRGTSAVAPGSGGGAGGYRSSYSTESSGGGGSAETSLTFYPGTVYTITVGGGGAGTGRNSGSNSSISGSDISTITSDGGGYGGGNDGSVYTGANGGSGGGAYQGAAGSGTANQGFDGAPGTNPSGSGDGGGGAGAQGVAGVGVDGGAGGAGVASTITGSSVTRGGGGGGAGDVGAIGPGGSGGGGDGGGGAEPPTLQPTNGSANTGGGGGGCLRNFAGGLNGGNGGSGVVILRLATANYSGTSTGSPTVTTDGTDTILTFTASGSYTA
jgi:hypothetical protein